MFVSTVITSSRLMLLLKATPCFGILHSRGLYFVLVQGNFPWLQTFPTQVFWISDLIAYLKDQDTTMKNHNVTF